MSDLATPHDTFFKVTFGDKDVAQDFLKHYLPTQIANVVDLNYLTKENNSFVDERFKECFTDMLYRTKINGEDGYIYFLFEHKSYQDPLVILQLLRYIVRIWEEKYDRKANRLPRLPIIIPMVIYHGESKWNVQTKLINLIKGIDGLPEETKKYIPVYEYELYDLSPFGQVVIVGLALTKVVLEVMQLVMITDTKKFDEAMKKVLEDIAQLPEDKFERFVEACITYILSVRDDVDIGTIEKESREILSERSDVIMSVAERLRNEGRLEGKAEGRLEGKIEFVLKNLSKKFGEDLTDEMKEKIQKADEKTIDYIGENLLDISLEQLKEVLK
ncbi:MAG TPA: Rpn family recombination-promoting nuclease/putative transposase [Fervidobacterium sp.]|nr:Rpn family recombination-promoting nuclease/putative transposase [Fervidobacterium sp.]HUM41967.1 Rpn family recombination-promoting nuclease/putative transposase [Fervidobacterium sp.]